MFISLPNSQQNERYKTITQQRWLYRLALGQPRQQDFIETMAQYYLPIELVMEDVSRSRLGRWRNLATGECRSAPPRVGELDWVEVTFASFCPD